MTFVAFLIVVLAVARVTRLVTTDTVTEPLRDRMVEHYVQDERPLPWFINLIGCDWCVSVWVGLAAAIVAYLSGFAPSWTWAAWLWPAASCGAALVLRYD